MKRFFNEQALIAYNKGNFDEALELLKKSLSDDGQQNEACKLIGNIYIQLNDLENALYYFNKSFQIKIEPDILLIIINLNIKLKNSNEAKSKLIKNIEILVNPIYINKLIRFLVILNLDINSYEIVKNFEIELVADEATLELFLKISFTNENLYLSDKILDRLIAIAPSNKKNIINKAIILRKINNNEGAINLLQNYLNKKNDDDIKYILSLILLHPVNLLKYSNNILIECEKIIESIKNKEVNINYKSLIQTFSLAYLKENPISLINKIGNLISEKKIIKSKNKNAIKNIGIVSAYFYKHSVWDAITFGLIQNLDFSKFKLFIYDTGKYNDTVFYSSIKNKPITHFKGDAENIKNQICIDEIDILIFPEIGMDPTTHNVAIDRHASVQISCWGHPITSGLNNIDYYIASEAFISNTSKDIYKESIILMPGIGSYYPNIIESNIPLIDKFNVSTQIILCPSNIIKFTQDFIDLIKDVGKSHPNYLIYIFESKEKDINDYIRNEFSCISNIIISSWLNYSDYLSILKRSFIILDSFYFSGFNTLMQAAHFNIPFVSLKSDFLKGNFGAGINKTLMIEELVAINIDDYRRIVFKLLLDVNYRDNIAKKINLNKNILFENDSFKIINNKLLEKLK